MKRVVSIAQLKVMTPRMQKQAMASLVSAARGAPNGEMGEVDAEIRTYERRYGIDSETLMRQLDAGEREESEDICRWLILLRLQTRLAR